MTAATVDLTDAFPGSVSVHACHVRPGDYVFGTYGQRDRVARVRVNRHVTRITPANLWPLTMPNGDAVTIIRGEVTR